MKVFFPAVSVLFSCLIQLLGRLDAFAIRRRNRANNQHYSCSSSPRHCDLRHAAAVVRLPIPAPILLYLQLLRVNVEETRKSLRIEQVRPPAYDNSREHSIHSWKLRSRSRRRRGNAPGWLFAIVRVYRLLVQPSLCANSGGYNSLLC